VSRKILFKVITGTEAIGFSNLASFEKVVVYLEELDSILTDDINKIGSGSPEETRFTTYGFYKALNTGFLGAMEALYGPDHLIEVDGIEFHRLRKYREQFRTQSYFTNVVLDAQKISAHLDSKYDPKLTPAQKKQLLGNVTQYKFLAMAMLKSAIDVGKNATLKPLEFPNFKTIKDMETYIEDSIGIVESFKFPEKIDRDLYFKIVRADYFKLNKHLL